VTFLFSNFIKTTLAANVTNTATSITLSSAANLPVIPTGYVLPVILNDAATGAIYEIVYCTAITGATLTVTRGEEGTAAVSWLSGDTVFSGPTAGSIIPKNFPNSIFQGLLSEGLPPPIISQCSAGAGTLAAGTYYYVVTALTPTGETTASVEASFTLSAAGGVNINWNPVRGASGYRIYGRTQQSELLIGTTTTETLFTDNGSVTYPSQVPSYRDTSGDVVALSGVTTPLSNNVQPTGVIIPLYYYPNNIYTDPVISELVSVMRKYPTVPFIVIINPSSGPGTATDGNIAVMIDWLRGFGAKVIGYIDSADTATPLSTLEGYVNTYTALYKNLDGIFIDNMNNTDPATDIPYYVAIKEYCHQNGYPLVVTNPGTTVYASYFAGGDIIMEVETAGYSTPTFYDEFYSGGAGIGVTRKQKAHIAYNVPYSPPNILLHKSAAQWLYVTDGPTSNPYNGLPSYLDELVGLLSGDTATAGGYTLTGLAVPVVTLAAAAGTLAAGTYAYRVTTVSNTGETLPSTEVSLTLAATGGVKISWTRIANAASYRVYGRTTGAELLIATVNNGVIEDGTATYTDTGAIVPAGAMPTTDTSGQLNGTTANFSGAISVGAATSAGEAVNLGQAYEQLSITANQSLTLTALETLVFSNGLTSNITITLEPGTIQGQMVCFMSGNPTTYEVTVNSNVTTGSPAFYLPDGTVIYSSGPTMTTSQGSFTLRWDGANWLCKTGGQVVIAPATASNQAVSLGQLQYSASSNVTASRAANTVYTNTNSKYLFVYVHGGSVVDSTAVLYATINGGVTMPFASDSNGSGSTYPSGMFVVPPGATYEVTTNGGGIGSWFEMY
jgi:hypothetical protein